MAPNSAVPPVIRPNSTTPGTGNRAFTPKTNGVTAARPGAPTPNAAAPGKTGAKTNAALAAKSSGTNAASSLLTKIKTIPSQPAFYPVIIGVIVALAILLVFRSAKSKEPKGEAVMLPEHAARPIVKKAGKQGFHSCNVLQVTPNASKVWQFDSRYHLSRDLTSVPGETLPPSMRKDWHSLFQRKLNVAWLPVEDVFLRVAQFPMSDFDETLNMVELQLEKLSPMPVAQVVWGLQTIPHPDGRMQTVIVMIISRNVVEEFLGKLEGQGYLADRLEMPLLDQLQATKVTENGAWIYPEAPGGRNAALVAWWYNNVLQNVNLVTLPSEQRADSIKEQLMQIAWAGEMEGWLTAPPRWHLVGDPISVADWEPPLREGLGQPVDVVAPVPPAALAAMTARRVALAEPAANLLPAEFSARYRQQFVDRLWMRGLAAVVLLYLAGVAIYAVAVGFANYRVSTVEAKVAELGPGYTNVMQLKARYAVLKERQELKFAGLDCWKTVAELLPEGVQMDKLSFSEGKKLTINGTAPREDVSKLNDFDAALYKQRKDGQPMFDSSMPDAHITWSQNSPTTVQWRGHFELKRTEGL